jgi:HSP20 family protein
LDAKGTSLARWARREEGIMANQRPGQEQGVQGQGQGQGQERSIERAQAGGRAMGVPRGGGIGVPTPFGFVRRMMEDMDRLFGVAGPRGLAGVGAATFQPDIEVFQRDNDLIVRVDLPGMGEDDVGVQLTDDGLLLEGERRFEHTESEGGVLVSERGYGRFQRLIPLPRGIDANNIEASFDNGVLEIRLPLPRAEQRRQIDVKSGKGAATQRQQAAAPQGGAAKAQEPPAQRR